MDEQARIQRLRDALEQGPHTHHNPNIRFVLHADLTALLAAHAALVERVDAIEAALDRDGYSYCERHGIQKWRGNLQLPKGYRGCGSCYWEQWYERKMAERATAAPQPAASPAATPPSLSKRPFDLDEAPGHG